LNSTSTSGVRTRKFFISETASIDYLVRITCRVRGRGALPIAAVYDAVV